MDKANGMGLTDDFITFSVYDILQCGTQNEIPCVHTSKRCDSSENPLKWQYRTKPHRNNATYTHTTHSNRNRNTNTRARTHECMVYTTAVMSFLSRSLHFIGFTTDLDDDDMQ